MRSDISSDLFLALLNDAWNNAQDAANTLRNQLLTEQSSALKFVKRGSLTSVSKNSSSQGYRGYGPGGLTQTQAVEAYSALLGAYDSFKRKITCAIDAEDITIPDDYDYDTPIYDLLTRCLEDQSGFDVLPDITQLRLPPCSLTSRSFVTW